MRFQPIVIPLLWGVSVAAAATVDRALPQLDRWNYPFNFTPGYRTAISTFSALGQEKLAGLTFDQRDAQMIIAWDTVPEIPAGQSAAAYCISEVTIRIKVSTDNIFRYDATPDPWQSYLPTDDPGYVPDADPGRPIEIFGAGFRAPWNLQNYYEGTAAAPGPGFGPTTASDVRFVYATDAYYGGTPDVSNNVRDGFDPIPFAIATCPLAPGALVPADTEFTFALDLDNPDVHRYVAAALDAGRLMLVIATLQPAQSGDGGGPGTGSFATFYAKEHIFSANRAARLHLEAVTRTPGDVDGDGHVNFDDLNELLDHWGEAVPRGTAGDVDCNGTVDFSDLNVVLDNWGT